MSDHLSTIEIPPASARALLVRAGELLRVFDLKGGQPGDLVAFCENDLGEHFSQARTRVENRRCTVTAGNQLWTNAVPPRVMFSITADDAGSHDLLYTACCRWALEKRFGVSANGCLEHLAEALSPWGISAAAIPDPLNLFFSVSVDGSGAIAVQACPSRAGACIELRAEMDCIVAISTCAVPRSDGPNTGYRVEVVRRDRRCGSCR